MEHGPMPPPSPPVEHPATNRVQEALQKARTRSVQRQEERELKERNRSPRNMHPAGQFPQFGDLARMVDTPAGGPPATPAAHRVRSKHEPEAAPKLPRPYIPSSPLRRQQLAEERADSLQAQLQEKDKEIAALKKKHAEEVAGLATRLGANASFVRFMPTSTDGSADPPTEIAKDAPIPVTVDADIFLVQQPSDRAFRYPVRITADVQSAATPAGLGRVSTSLTPPAAVAVPPAMMEGEGPVTWEACDGTGVASTITVHPAKAWSGCVKTFFELILEAPLPGEVTVDEQNRIVCLDFGEVVRRVFDDGSTSQFVKVLKAFLSTRSFAHREDAVGKGATELMEHLPTLAAVLKVTPGPGMKHAKMVVKDKHLEILEMGLPALRMNLSKRTASLIVDAWGLAVGHVVQSPATRERALRQRAIDVLDEHQRRRESDEKKLREAQVAAQMAAEAAAAAAANAAALKDEMNAVRNVAEGAVADGAGLREDVEAGDDVIFQRLTGKLSTEMGRIDFAFEVLAAMRVETDSAAAQKADLYTRLGAMQRELADLAALAEKAATDGAAATIALSNEMMSQAESTHNRFEQLEASIATDVAGLREDVEVADDVIYEHLMGKLGAEKSRIDAALEVLAALRVEMTDVAATAECITAATDKAVSQMMELKKRDSKLTKVVEQISHRLERVEGYLPEQSEEVQEPPSTEETEMKSTLMRAKAKKELEQLMTAGSMTELLAKLLSLLPVADASTLLLHDQLVQSMKTAVEPDSLALRSVGYTLIDALETLSDAKHTQTHELLLKRTLGVAPAFGRTALKLLSVPTLYICHDLDEMLTHLIHDYGEDNYNMPEPLSAADARKECDHIISGHGIVGFMKFRPFLALYCKMLTDLKELFKDKVELVFPIMTAGMPQYANLVLDTLVSTIPDAAVLGPRVCNDELARINPEDKFAYKDLRLITEKMENVVLFDNSMFVCLQPENVGLVRSWTQDEDDVELIRIYLLVEQFARAMAADPEAFDVRKALRTAKWSLKAVFQTIKAQAMLLHGDEEEPRVEENTSPQLPRPPTVANA